MSHDENGNIYWLASYPKSGNTWVRAFIADLRNEKPEGTQAGTMDINGIQTGSIAASRGWVQTAFDFDINELSHDEVDRLRPEAYIWLSQQMLSPEYHKIHDAYTTLADGRPLIPSGATRGVLYLVRNPLDVAVSLAHHNQTSIDVAIDKMANPVSTFSGHIKKMNIQLRQHLLTWSAHVASWQNAPLNVKFVRYEDMIYNPIPTFTGIANFLALPNSEEAVRASVDACQFEKLKMQENDTVFKEKPQNAPCFFRKGQVGDWQSCLSVEQIDRVIRDHGEMMSTLGYLDEQAQPMEQVS
ncbi:MAG: sulfotransferase domain-containing protein [Agarilytica sp.]